MPGAWGWDPHHLHVPNVMKIWEPKPPGTLWATPGLLREFFTFCFYISTSRSMCAVPNMAVVCSSLISRNPGTLLRYCLGNFDMVPVPLLLQVYYYYEVYSNGRQGYFIFRWFFFSISFPFFPFILSSSTSRNHFVRGRSTVLFRFQFWFNKKN